MNSVFGVVQSDLLLVVDGGTVDVCAGTPALAVWALLLGGLLIAGALLVYQTSALSG